MADLRCIEDFLDLSLTRSFTRTADNRFVTQPTLTRRIKNLEYWVGSPLLNRKTIPIELTPEGMRFLSAAKNFLRLLEKLPDIEVDTGIHRAALSHSFNATDDESFPQESARNRGGNAIALPPAKGQKTKNRRCSGEKIAVVDDSPVSAKIIASVIEKLGHETIAFTDGYVAVRAILSDPVSLLLTDCDMPDFDGYQLTEAIRSAEYKGEHRTPIVAVTSHTALPDIHRCFDVGMDDYLSKPICHDDLEIIVNRWLNPSDTVEGAEAVLLNASTSDNQLAETDRELLHDFWIDCQPKVVRIAELADLGDAETVYDDISGIKSEAFMVGAYTFGRSCGQLQKAAKEGDSGLMLEKVGPFLGSYVKFGRLIGTSPN